jgi:hypothetical protein
MTKFADLHAGGVTEGPAWNRAGAKAVCICGWSEEHDTAFDAHVAVEGHLGWAAAVRRAQGLEDEDA